ncbi:MAG: hypothetical protein RDU25_02890 [Patescibacteria group bacterium]|nr:hypothetical protein [Patescibacteria group bacterium]
MVGSIRTASELTIFVEKVMRDKCFSIYRRDVVKLLMLLSSTLHQVPYRPWYLERYDKLGIFCHYLAVKMSYDAHLEVSEGVPVWLNVLAGRYDCPGMNSGRNKVEAFLRLAPDVAGLLKKYGPDNVQTMPPPPLLAS